MNVPADSLNRSSFSQGLDSAETLWLPARDTTQKRIAVTGYAFIPVVDSNLCGARYCVRLTLFKVSAICIDCFGVFWNRTGGPVYTFLGGYCVGVQVQKGNGIAILSHTAPPENGYQKVTLGQG
jgi:hypothetical protein